MEKLINSNNNRKNYMRRNRIRIGIGLYTPVYDRMCTYTYIYLFISNKNLNLIQYKPICQLIVSYYLS